MGRRPGEPLVRVADVEVVSVRREPLELITAEDLVREGFPGMSRDEFIRRYFLDAQGIQPGDLVTRIEWTYLEPVAAGEVRAGDKADRRPRVLVTGSRMFTDAAAIRDALAAVWQQLPGAVLVSGACGRGADLLSEACWTHWGGQVEQWPADWRGPCAASCPPGHRRQGQRGASICAAAGMVRNAAMVAAGAEMCLAFIRDRSRGATQCATTAQRAGIPTVIHRYR